MNVLNKLLKLFKKAPTKQPKFEGPLYSDTVRIGGYSEGYKEINSIKMPKVDIRNKNTIHIDPWTGADGSHSAITSKSKAIITHGLNQCAAIGIAGKTKQYLAHIHKDTPIENLVEDFTAKFGNNIKKWNKAYIGICLGKDFETRETGKLILKALEEINPQLSKRANFYHFPEAKETVVMTEGKMSAMAGYNLPKKTAVNSGLTKIW